MDGPKREIDSRGNASVSIFIADGFTAFTCEDYDCVEYSFKHMDFEGDVCEAVGERQAERPGLSVGGGIGDHWSDDICPLKW